MFKINNAKCVEVGSILSSIPMRDDAFNSLGPILNDKLTRALAFLYVSAICHQTETLSGSLNGQSRKGWDYLMGKFIETGTKDPSALSPYAIKELTAEGLQSIVSDNGDASISTLSRAEERAGFLRQICDILINDYQGNPLQLWGSGFLGGQDGLYGRMAKFSAFGKDPTMKKATVYFMLMNKSGLWEDFKDPQKLRPMPDYHKMRLFLRTGCVETDDEIVDSKLKNKVKQDIGVDNQLRESTADAYRIVLEHSNKDFFELEVLLWSFARSLCYHSSRCVADTGMGNLPEYANIRELKSCPLETVCRKEVEYWHPIVDTHFH